MAAARGPAAGYDYEAIAGPEGTETRSAAVSRRRAMVMVAVGSLMAVACVAAVGGGQAEKGMTLGTKQLDEERKKGMVLGSKQLGEGLSIVQTKKKVKYFTLGQDTSLGSQESTWSYVEGAPTGPAAWSTVAPEFALCSSGQMQSPININRGQEKASLSLPPLRWDGYEQEPFVQEGRESRAFFDGHSISLGGPSTTAGMAGPKITVHGFSRYLPDLPLDAVALVDYTFKEIRFHTPSEHHIDGVSFPFEMQMVHECLGCPIKKTMIVSVLFTKARKGWGEESPSFISSLMDDLHLIEGVWSQYVESFAFDFGQIAKAINMYTSRYFLFKGSLTVPPCTEDVTWIVLKDQLTISEKDLLYAEKIQKSNVRPLQPWNDRVTFGIN